MSTAALALLCAALAVAGALALAALRAAGDRAAPPLPPLADSELEAAAGIEEELAALVRHPTVSRYDPALEDPSAFEALAAELPRLFPRVHAAIGLERVGDRALLYTWKGEEAALKPVLLNAHFDVVPAEDAAEWRHQPFSGDLAEGCVWGRGTQDIKLTMASILHAAERLLAAGFKPRRTLYFAFGGDEEVGGLRGAAAIGELLARRGVRASFVLDEGGPVADGLFAFADRPVALVGVAEKGYVDVALEAAGSGGHASMPPRRTAAGSLARAVAAVEARRGPARICRSVRALLQGVSRYSGFAYRLLFRNLWLTAPLVKAAFSASGSTNSLIRTTAAPTMLQGSPKENVLADKARAILNVRILPGDSSAAVLGRLSRAAARFGATALAAHPAAVVEPSPESPAEHEGYRAIRSALGASFPEAGCAPFLLSGGTDTKHYLKVAEAVYRFTPLRQTSADLAGIHGRDERVEVGNLRRCALFYAALMRSL
ncbi:MAG TPA: M20/M25/M40 family metallo-hydrolase [Spirochaetales bacterium]|nr:M20/M25/M40 family metallo-hydrolase [Spirochaetales bacterium]HRZ63492.1 M20/M25/M40 family metallo-hydrolase [Spirochaetia bacterium]